MAIKRMNKRSDNIIETERATLHPFSKSDADELLALFRVPDVRRFLLDDILVSADWVLDEIEASDARFKRSGTGLWSVRIKGSTDIIGFAGFREFFDPPQLQLLYGLLPACWGHGLATEVASRICDHAFRNLGFLQVNAATDIPNEASVKVLRRLGMKQTHTSTDGLMGTAFFVVDCDTWFAIHGE